MASTSPQVPHPSRKSTSKLKNDLVLSLLLLVSLSLLSYFIPLPNNKYLRNYPPTSATVTMTRRSRRPRPKSRKPKYLSLRRYLAPPPPPASADAATLSSLPPVPEERTVSSCSDMPSSSSSSYSAVAPLPSCEADEDSDKGPQPLLPSLLQPPDHLDRDPHVASLLVLDDDNRTLDALFGDDGTAAKSTGSPSPASAADSPASSSLNWDGLARRALRGRERWVYCHSSSSSPPAASSSGDEEASSAGGEAGRRAADLWRRFAGTEQSRALALKLDYEEIIASWSDRGPLYIEGEEPQVVPQLHGGSRAEPYYAFPVMVKVGPSEAWRVPEFVGAPAALEIRPTEDGKAEAEEEKRSRKERVRRYKEKRRSRLFAKRIRYEVRKQNAEKRPRFKGRFVKRKDDSEDLAFESI